jgi:hypothetical protein
MLMTRYLTVALASLTVLKLGVVCFSPPVKHNLLQTVAE